METDGQIEIASLQRVGKLHLPTITRHEEQKTQRGNSGSSSELKPTYTYTRYFAEFYSDF